MSDKETKKREYLDLFSFVTSKNDTITFRLNPDEPMTKEQYDKYSSPESLNEERITSFLKSKMEHTIYINYNGDKEKFEKIDISKLDKKVKLELLAKVLKVMDPNC